MDDGPYRRVEEANSHIGSLPSEERHLPATLFNGKDERLHHIMLLSFIYMYIIVYSLSTLMEVVVDDKTEETAT